jgi:Ca2+-transporting ATPase
MAFITIIFTQLFYSLSFRHNTKSIFQSGFFSNRYLVGAIVIGILLQLIILQTPVMRNAFKLQILDTQAWVEVTVLGVAPLILNELMKVYLRLKLKKVVKLES